MAEGRKCASVLPCVTQYREGRKRTVKTEQLELDVREDQGREYNIFNMPANAFSNFPIVVVEAAALNSSLCMFFTEASFSDGPGLTCFPMTLPGPT